MTQETPSTGPGSVWSVRGESSGGPTLLRLYIAGGTPNSVRAEDNLATAMEKLGSAGDSFTIEVIDVFLESRMAMKDGILVTPTLIASGSGARRVIVGDLVDEDQLRSTLQRLTSNGVGSRPKP